jgi:hypothetical protein
VSPPDPDKVAGAAKDIYQRLFRRPFEARQFSQSLVDGFTRAGGRSGESILLIDVHRQIFLARQPADFFKDMSAKKLIEYRLDEFSVDLARFLEAGAAERPGGRRLTLELGRDGIVVFSDRGTFESYKFLKVE